MVEHHLVWIIEVGLDPASEDKFKVVLLAFICHVNDSIGSQLADSVSQRCHIRSVIVEATVRFLDYQRHLLLGHKDANGAITFDGHACSLKFFNHWPQHRIVKRLSHL